MASLYLQLQPHRVSILTITTIIIININHNEIKFPPPLLLKFIHILRKRMARATVVGVLVVKANFLERKVSSPANMTVILGLEAILVAST